MTKNILLVGVGGQGTILTSKILSRGFMEKGYDVKMSEIHGMSQRGGTVTTQIRFGEKVYSPVIEKGTADIIVAFEKCEAIRYIDNLKDNGILVVNDYEIHPVTVAIGMATYPTGLIESYKSTVKNTYIVDAFNIALGLGNAKTMNVVLLGALVKMMGLTDIDWKAIIEEEVPSKAVEINIKAFEKGFDI
ncbi:MAG: indolepyruvate oxidoreductase subunit beta [Anaerotignaceae bacterium]